jgi:hypothetical protein
VAAMMAMLVVCTAPRLPHGMARQLKELSLRSQYERLFNR